MPSQDGDHEDLNHGSGDEFVDDDDPYLDIRDFDDEDDDLDFPYDGPTRPFPSSHSQLAHGPPHGHLTPTHALGLISSASRISLPPPAQYTLIAFSTGMILEDSYDLAWYHLRAHELVELHPLGGSVVDLKRGDRERYVMPYFEGRVRALRVIGSAEAVTSVVDGHGKEDEGRDGEERGERGRNGKKRKAKLEWRERWVVVHQGMLSLYKERGVSLLPFVSLQILVFLGVSIAVQTYMERLSNITHTCPVVLEWRATPPHRPFFIP